MLTLINANRMSPPIGPIGLDYVATAARRSGIDTRVVDLGLAKDPDAELRRGLSGQMPHLVGISFRNVDDSFWPSGTWFVPALCELVQKVRNLTDAPIVLGGVGVSIFARAILEATGADFALRGDGELAIVALHRAVSGRSPLETVPGLVFRSRGAIVANAPAWDEPLSVPTSRDAIDNAEYFRRGGQAGVETKRGCPRSCIYCADPVAKGRRARCRPPADVADEFEALAGQGISAIHLCDGEFNVEPAHALEVCAELVRRGVAERIQWYAYLATTPFDAALASWMRRAGCIGINFGADSASDAVLARYQQAHRRRDLANTVRLCRLHGIRCMIDLLLGGPGETPETIAETIRALQAMDPHCVGAGIGMRLYPETRAATMLLGAQPSAARPNGASPLWKAGSNPNHDPPGIRRHYTGPIDLLKPTFYVAPALGEHPAGLVRELIAGDARFFPPADDSATTAGEGAGAKDHNYNANTVLEDAIRRGARGAYWDILKRNCRPAS